MKAICVVTTTRAEYGILTPLIKRLASENVFETRLVVSGTHLSKEHGYTIREIEKDGVPIDATVEIMEPGNDAFAVSKMVSNAIVGFADYFRLKRPDLLILLGDRTEMLGVAVAALNETIPIAHIHGGEVTEGAVDDCVRHCLTKMSVLHFTSTEAYRRRVIQMGENPDRVFHVGALGAENISRIRTMNRDAFYDAFHISPEMKLVVVTLHPETMESRVKQEDVFNGSADIARMLCDCMDWMRGCFYIITGANADKGADEINRIFKEYVKKRENAVFVMSLGMERYLNALRHASFVLGNSSSGLIEAPILGTPTVNIGNRQQGRLLAETVISCKAERQSVCEAMKRALDMIHRPSKMYGEGDTSQRILKILKRFLADDDEGMIGKRFYDIPVKVGSTNI